MQYLIFLSIIWGFIFLNFKIKKSREVFDLLIILTISNFLSYFLVKSNEIVFINLSEVIYISAFLLLVLFVSIRSYWLQRKDKHIEIEENLVYKREKDLERLLQYVNNFNTIGINAEWGTGKSFIVNQLYKKIRTQYEIIEIDILACNIDEILLILINEIEKVMYKHGMVSKYSKKLKSFIVEDSNINKVLGLFFHGNYSYSETIRGFKQELKLIDKEILIVYEDIDRISDDKVIKKIFYLSEKLCTDNIKILYQYDENKLKCIGFTNEYLEKYIPFKINLTKITFFELIEFILQEKKINQEVLNLEDFKFLQNYQQQYRFDIIKRKFDIEEPYLNVQRQYYSVRVIEHFIDEINLIIMDEPYNHNKETVITFFYIKHFYSAIYEELEVAESIIDTIKFDVDSQKYTISKIIYMKKEIVENLFKNEQNIENYCILKLLNYNSEHYLIEDVSEKIPSILMEPERMLNSRNENDKKDRIIWSLLENGKSRYTNYEFVAKKVIQEVLSQEPDDQITAFNKFYNELFHMKFEKMDNETIFLMGIPWAVELFKSFLVIDADFKNRTALFELYLKMKKTTDFDIEIIYVLNYFSIKDKKSYIWILNKINSLNVIGNFNSHKMFNNLLQMYVDYLFRFGYVSYRHYRNLLKEINVIKGYEELVIDDLEAIVNGIQQMNLRIVNEIDVVEIRDELQIIMTFIKKMIEIIKNEYEIKDNHGIKIKTTSQTLNNKEYERIKKILDETDDKKLLENVIRQSYLNGGINIYEINDLFENKN